MKRTFLLLLIFILPVISLPFKLDAQILSISNKFVTAGGRADEEWIEAKTEVTNLTARTVYVSVDVDTMAIPEPWEYSMCLNQCINDGGLHWDDQLAADETYEMHVIILPINVDGVGEISVSITNKNDDLDKQRIHFTIIVSKVGIPPLPAIDMFALQQAYPNPYFAARSPEVVFNFTSAAAAEVTLEIFDFAGRTSATLRTAAIPGSITSVAWNGLLADGSTAPAGLYFYRLTANGVSSTKRFLLVR